MKINKISKYHVLVLLLIITVGIFLRTYHFKDWLQFNPDQVRDATVINDVISHGKALPLLGTIAGGTNFHLGPIFYYFQYIAAIVFGNSPEKLAYPDLFFSILAIPLLFLFLKKYFSNSVSLALVTLFSVSYFAVINSRFAWNPNSIPFFVLLFLYALLEIMNPKNREVYHWSLLAGLALGVGIQLHTLLLLILPVVTIIVLVYLTKKKNVNWKSAVIVFLFAIFLNIPQILSEIKTHGVNTSEFFVGSTTQTNKFTDIGYNIENIISCQAEFNLHMISSYENKERCASILNAEKSVIKKYAGVPGNFSNEYLFILSEILGILFSLGGYILLAYYFYKEKDSLKRDFLGLIIVFNLVSMVALVPVASHITMRYFIILFFMPLALLGFWIKFLIEKNRKIFMAVAPIVFGILLMTNLFVVVKSAVPYMQGLVNDANNSILGETQLMADFIINNSGNQSVAYMTGEKFYVKRFFPALGYISERSGLRFVKLMNENSVLKQQSAQQLPIFYIANTGATNYKTGDIIDNCVIISLSKFNISLHQFRK